MPEATGRRRGLETVKEQIWYMSTVVRIKGTIYVRMPASLRKHVGFKGGDSVVIRPLKEGVAVRKVTWDELRDAMQS